MPSPVLLALDVSNVVNRAYYAASAGKEGESVFGLARHNLKRMVRTLISEAQPVRIVGALDSPTTTFRAELMRGDGAGYKGHRKEKPAELTQLMQAAPELLREAGVELYVAPGFEADDVLATLADQCVPYGWRTLLVTGDMDLFGAVYQGEGYAGTFVYRYEQGRYVCYGPQDVLNHKKIGVLPPKVALFKALAGDSSDGYAGVPGIGPVAGRRLATQYPGMRSLIRHLGDLTPKERAKFEAVGEDGLLRLERIARLVTDAPIVSA